MHTLSHGNCITLYLSDRGNTPVFSLLFQFPGHTQLHTPFLDNTQEINTVTVGLHMHTLSHWNCTTLSLSDRATPLFFPPQNYIPHFLQAQLLSVVTKETVYKTKHWDKHSTCICTVCGGASLFLAAYLNFSCSLSQYTDTIDCKTENQLSDLCNPIYLVYSPSMSYCRCLQRDA